MQYISAEVYANKSRIIKPAKIALTGGTILTKHKNINKETMSANSQIFGFSRLVLPALKIFPLHLTFEIHIITLSKVIKI